MKRYYHHHVKEKETDTLRLFALLWQSLEFGSELLVYKIKNYILRKVWLFAKFIGCESVSKR